MGMGVEVKINEVGDYIFSDELKSEGALINDSCNMSCLSVPARCSRGWSFWAKDDSAKFISPNDKEYDFTLHDGLYKLNKQQKVTQTEYISPTRMRRMVQFGTAL